MASLQRVSAAESSAIRVLVVDDDAVFARALQRVLGLRGFDVDTVLDGRAALGRIDGGDYDVMLLDLRIGGMDSLEMYAAIADHSPPATIIHSAHIDVRTAVLATRAGVNDVMQKPVPEEILAARIRELATGRRQARLKPPAEAQRLSGLESLSRLIGTSAKARELRDQVRRVAEFRDVAVLIQGPTGTGKELVAQAIHALSCQDKPLVSLNCAAVPEHLFESELFGHEAGAFTSARAPRVGLLEEANTGTLFLDEIGEMPLALQAKLLRVLEIRQFRRVGGTRSRVFAARVISATNRPVTSSLGGSMRPDLFFRLAGYSIHTPPLNERISDVPELARHFLAEFAKRHTVHNITLSSDALAALLDYSWPGNVRELRAVVENAAILAQHGVIERSHVALALRARATATPAENESWQGPVAANVDLPDEVTAERPIAGAAPGPKRRRSLPDLQRDLILRAFEDSEHNLSKAAVDLGIPRSTLRARLKRYGVR